MAKHFLYLTNEAVTCLVWKSGTFVSRRMFAARDVYAPDFEKYIAGLRREPAYLLLDLTEEDFRLEVVPHLRGSDQDAFLSRKLGQVYRATAYRHAVIQGREAEGRRDDRVLYHAVTNPELVRPWLTVLEKFEVPLEGVYSVPVLSGRLLKSLDIFFPHTLLVSLVAGHGLRQTYFQNKQVKFSRLTPIEPGDNAAFGEQIADETSRTWQYLDSLRHFTAEDTLEVCILVHPKDRKSVTNAIRSYPLLQYRILDTDEVAAKIGLRPPPLASESEEIFAYLFADAGIENHFAQPEQTRYARMRRAGLGMYVFTGAILAAGMAWAGYTFYRGSALDNEIQARDRSARELTDRYRSFSASLPKSDVSPETSRDTAALYKSYLQPVPSPGQFLRKISHVLDAFPQVQVAQIVWEAADDPKATPAFSAVTPKAPAPVHSEAAAPDKSAAPTVPVLPATPTGAVQLPPNRYEVMVLDASIPVAGDYRRALGEVDRFVAALNAAGLQAALLASPLDVRPTASIQAKLSESSGAPVEGRFAVRILRTDRTDPGGT